MELTWRLLMLLRKEIKEVIESKEIQGMVCYKRDGMT